MGSQFCVISFFVVSQLCFVALVLSENANMKPLPNEKPNNVTDVCSVCRCTVDQVDCSNLKLADNLNDHKWPETILKVVTFENNHITRIKPFSKVVINKLIFRNNSIKKIDNQSFKQLINLTELDLSQNLLTYENFMPNALEGRNAPEAYKPLAKLTLLNLSTNQFHSLNHDLFEHVKDLKVLILSNNPFTVFDHSSTIALSDVPYLEELDLSHCHIQHLDEVTLNSLRYLKKLDISYNLFPRLPDALRQSKSLQTLILDGNPIETISSDNAFSLLPNLKYLSMRNMSDLRAIKKYALSNLEALESLVIENCPKFSEISELAFVKHEKEGAATWPPLKTLNMSNNALRYLPGNLVARWDKLEELHLINNEWNCDCDNQYLIGILLPQQGERLMGNEMSSLICTAPAEHRNQALKSLASWKLRCVDMYGAQPERDAAILVGMLIGLLLALPIAIVFFVLWRRGLFFCGPQGPASFSRAFYKRAPPDEDHI